MDTTPRTDIYFPVLTIIVGLACSVYVFEELEKERTDKRIGKVLFAVSTILLMYFGQKESKLVAEDDVKLLYYFLTAASLLVAMIIAQA